MPGKGQLQKIFNAGHMEVKHAKKNQIVPKPTKLEKRAIQLTADYRDEIELLCQHVKSNPLVSQKMFTAKVSIVDEGISGEVFEIIHQYLVNSLHVYKGDPFPMFHDIAHADGEIRIVCEDESSFDYLSKCILALSENLDIPMETEQLSGVRNVFWFSVQMEGLVGAQSFLAQIEKHRFGLIPSCWIIVSQNPHQTNNKTNMQIIIDEHSAMVLIYRHYLKLFVCMQEVEFNLKAIIPLGDYE